MRINSSTNLYNKNFRNSYKVQKLAFTSSSRNYYNSELLRQSRTFGHIATTTWMFRQDLDWDRFINLVYRNFENQNCVQTYNLACSDGSEAYSFLISAMEKFPNEGYKKFIPIIAVDKDLEIIHSAQHGRINLSESDLNRINIFSRFRNEYFFDKQISLNINNDNFSDICNSYAVSKKLRNMVDFNHGDLLTYLSKINDNGNSIIFCRNVTPYLSYNDIFKLANTVGKVLKQGSMIVFGEFDKHSGILDFIDIKGFEECMEYVFRKI